MAILNFAKKTAIKTIQQKIINGVIVLVAGSGVAVSRTELGTRVLVVMAEFLRDNPLVLAILREVVESEGPQAIDVMVDELLSQRNITGEARDAFIDAADDIGEALGKRGADALAPENLDAYILAARARLAADTRRRTAIVAQSTLIQPAAIAGITGAPMPTGLAGEAHALAVFSTTLSDSGRRLLEAWFTPIDTAITTDTRGEVPGARVKLRRMYLAVQADEAGMRTEFENAVRLWGLTTQAINYLHAQAKLRVPEDRAGDIAADATDAALPTNTIITIAEVGGAVLSGGFLLWVCGWTIIMIGLFGTGGILFVIGVVRFIQKQTVYTPVLLVAGVAMILAGLVPMGFVGAALETVEEPFVLAKNAIIARIKQIQTRVAPPSGTP